MKPHPLRFPAPALPDSTLEGTPGPDQLEGTSADELLRGLAGDDWLRGNGGRDTLRGGEGNDTLVGGNRRDVLRGGQGDDTLYGGDGHDVFVFGHGDGHDVIEHDGSDTARFSDTLHFTTGVTPDEVSAVRLDEYTIEMRLASGDTVRFIDPTAPDSPLGSSIDRAVFADGTRWDLATIRALTRVGNDTDQLLHGTDQAELLDGGAGRDTLLGNGGDDTLDGGAGIDFLDGGEGHDTYLFGIGSGSDRITYSFVPGDFTDVVQMGDGVRPEDVSVERPFGGKDLVLALASGDGLRVERFFTTFDFYDGPLEEVRFSDGTVWTRDDLLVMAHNPDAPRSDAADWLL